jgi:sortase A
VTVGRVFLVAGILVLLFIPYLLWGTGLITARAQSALRGEFIASQHLHHESATTRRPATPTTPTSPPVIAPTVPAPAPGSPVGILSIPKISLSMVIVEGTNVEQLRSGPGHYLGTPLPGEAGNAAIAGHRTTYLHPFYNLNELVPGDPIDIRTAQGWFVYQVTGSQAVAPTDVAVVAPTPTPELTLTTCNPRYSASQRLVVQASLVADVLTGAPAPATAPAPAPAPAHPSTPTHRKVKSTAPAALQRHWWQAILWGVAVAALITGIWVLALRVRGGTRAAVLGVGLVVWLGLVFVFFGSLAPLLPASY